MYGFASFLLQQFLDISCWVWGINFGFCPDEMAEKSFTYQMNKLIFLSFKLHLPVVETGLTSFDQGKI